MQKWIETFQKHTIHTTLNDLSKVIGELLDQHKDNEAWKSDFERMEQIVDFISNRLENAVPQLVSVDDLNGMNGQLTNALNELNSLKQDNNNAHIENAHNQLSRQAHHVSGLPTVGSGKGEKATAAIIAAMNKQIERMIADGARKKEAVEADVAKVSASLVEINRELAAVSESLKNQKTSIETLSTEYQKQFSENQESRRREFAEQLAEMQKRISEFTADLNVRLEAERQTVNTSTSAEIKAQQEKFSALVKETTATLTKLIDDQKETSEELVNQLTEKDKQASRLLEAVGIKSHTSGYASAASTEGKAAIDLRRGAIFFMVLALLVLIAPVIKHLFTDPADADIDWLKVLYRVPVTAVLFVPGLYLASEAAKHRRSEIENKRIELELAALMPYMELMPEPEKVKIKEQLVTNYFIGHKRTESSRSDKLIYRWFDRHAPRIIDSVIDRFSRRRKKVDDE